MDGVARDDDWLESGGHEAGAEGAGEAGPEGHADDLDRDADDDFEQPPSTDAPQDPGGSALPPKVEAWRKRSATGAMLTGIAFGLQQVFGKEREEPAIVMTTSGDPPRDLPVEAEVEHGRPRRAVVNIRPWLLDTRGGPGSAAGPESGGSGSGGPESVGPGSSGGASDPAGAGDDDPPPGRVPSRGHLT